MCSPGIATREGFDEESPDACPAINSGSLDGIVERLTRVDDHLGGLASTLEQERASMKQQLTSVRHELTQDLRKAGQELERFRRLQRHASPFQSDEIAVQRGLAGLLFWCLFPFFVLFSYYCDLYFSSPSGSHGQGHLTYVENSLWFVGVAALCVPLSYVAHPPWLFRWTLAAMAMCLLYIVTFKHDIQCKACAHTRAAPNAKQS
ncbi:unnamed protein product [Vitrella brassicaformis CCMP3155]|uniref:Uncharacterized protein n=2 Tax=Vitrella brassicaformis TaxID=1169539 RepID=A0A0G4GV93_VITBC|nr:unnamed protein product [Vitrella brassicaformis CCMP3155]|eukprot:CEM34777.1 unnamed protein product [Vitrella brassicaformis CCMP3155]